MFNLFKKQQPDWLAGYPVYAAPHVGNGRTLTEVQALENLDYLLANKSHRLDVLSTELEKVNIDLAAGFTNNSSSELTNDLYQWAGEQ